MHKKNILVSIITPCFNSAKFIERTIKSVLNQSYKNIEYIIIDGGSNDGTVDIIKKYENKISYWSSEPDKGMYYAINKGMYLAKGEVVAYLNSDDIYYPDTLKKVISLFQARSDIDFVYGKLNFINKDDSKLYTLTYPIFNLDLFKSSNYSMIGQPSSFWKRDLMKKVNYFDVSFTLASDFDFFIKCGMRGKFFFTPEILAAFRIHSSQLTSRYKIRSQNEIKIIHKRYHHNKFISYFYSLYFKIINIKALIQKFFLLKFTS